MGVDLNRNFDVDFGYVDEITLFQTEWQEKKEDKDRANNPCSTNYPGSEALSE